MLERKGYNTEIKTIKTYTWVEEVIIPISMRLALKRKGFFFFLLAKKSTVAAVAVVALMVFDFFFRGYWGRLSNGAFIESNWTRLETSSVDLLKYPKTVNQEKIKDNRVNTRETTHNNDPVCPP